MKSSLNRTASPFEPNPRVEQPAALAAAAPAAPVEATSADLFAAIEAKRMEMINDVYARLTALRAKPVELRKRAAEMRQERDRLLLQNAVDRAASIDLD